jgi:pimeloyl-ACP methyl ester carboxylesterase
MRARDTSRLFAVAAMALAAATSCGGGRASTGEVEGPRSAPAAGSDAPTTSPAPAASAAEETTSPWSEGMSETAPNRFLEKNGVRFAYRAFGRKPGVPLLLLAPFRGTMDDWDPLLTDALAQERPIILFDNAGVGLSSGEAPETVAAMARDAETFVQGLGELHFTDTSWVSGRVDLLGFSLGGFVAQELALTFPNTIDRVVLAGTAPRGGEGFATLPREIAKSESARGQTPRDVLLLLFARSEASEAAGRAFLARAGARRRDGDTSVSTKTMLAQLAAIEAWGTTPAMGRDAYLSRIKQHVLVADGEADVVMPTTNSRALAQSLPSARLLVYPDSAHGFLFQYPETFAKDVAGFLQRP